MAHTDDVASQENQEDAAVSPLHSVQLDAQEFSFEKAVGGWRGCLESIGPLLLFTIIYLFTYSIQWPLISAFTVAVVTALLRLLDKTSLKQVAVGLIGIAIAVIWAWTTGEPKDFFALGLWINAVYGGIVLLSILVRYPLVGLAVAAAYSCLNWWKTPQARVFYLRSVWATWVWVVLFGLRLVIEVPLYYVNAVAALGIARLILGVPLFAVAAWLTWVMMKTVLHLVKHADEGLPGEVGK
ncbi:MAG: DUF3159 domain-containing protein [Actinomycetaceae bacterium]|nr:DUF3159 domain-containing protein [Actinomycetaceae bacterium]